MKPFFGFGFALLGLFPYITAAQNSTSSPIADLAKQLPTCALTCLVTAIGNSDCAVTDQACLCTTTSLQDEATECILGSCTVLETLHAKNVTETSCGAPVRDRSELHETLSIVLGVVSASFVVLRVGFKLLITRADLGLDDWFIVITLLVGVPSTVMNVHGLSANGLGRDIWTLTHDTVTKFVKFLYVMEILYFAQVALLKLSLLFFYLHIFPGTWTRRLLWGTVVFDCLFGLAFVLVAIFMCQPISFFWTGWDGLHEGKCLSVNSIAWANAAISITLDLWMLAIPLANLHQLKLHWKKKIGVAIMFIVGTFVTVISIVRLHSIIKFANSVNPTQDNFEITVWSTVEITIGIICACMPALRLVLVHFFPRIMGSTLRGPSTAAKYYASDARGVARSATRCTKSQPDTLASAHNASAGGIMYSKSFAVEYRDHDEISLVRMGKDVDVSPRGSLSDRANS